MNKQFEEWLKSYAILKAFKSVPESMRWGTYLEFFDSVGIMISIGYDQMGWQCVLCKAKHGTLLSILNDSESRQEAQQEAINKAFEILNKQS